MSNTAGRRTSSEVPGTWPSSAVHRMIRGMPDSSMSRSICTQAMLLTRCRLESVEDGTYWSEGYSAPLYQLSLFSLMKSRNRCGFISNRAAHDLSLICLMQQSCYGHATVMQQSCNSHAIVMQQSCNSHAIVMQQSCNGHATVMQRSCNAHATALQWSCNLLPYLANSHMHLGRLDDRYHLFFDRSGTSDRC